MKLTEETRVSSPPFGRGQQESSRDSLRPSATSVKLLSYVRNRQKVLLKKTKICPAKPGHYTSRWIILVGKAISALYESMISAILRKKTMKNTKKDCKKSMD
ncbi:MAG: hypothetical protein ACE5GN_05590 [Waddliaceae bacterium]